MATLGKPQRQHRILRILEEQPVSSQSQLVQLLEAEGIVATQATVSRDLEELGAVKVRIPGGTMAYAIPDYTRGDRAGSDDHLKRLMGEFVARGRAQRQHRRAAHAAGKRARRRRPRSTAPALPDMLGTVAGDDTVFVVVQGVRRRRRRRGRARRRSPACNR